MKEKMRNMSIKYKIWGYLISFSILLLGFLWVAQVGFLNASYKIVKMYQTRQAAKSIEKAIDDVDASEIIGDIAHENEVCVLVLSSTATEIFSVDELKDCAIHKIPIFEKTRIVVRTLEKNKEIYDNYERRGGKLPGSKVYLPHEPDSSNAVRYLVYSKPMKNKDGKDMVIIVNAQVAPVDATVDTLRIQLTFVTIITLIVAGVLSLSISKKVARPIEKLNNSTKILAHGDYSVIFEAIGYKEINELSNTLSCTAIELSKVEKLRQEFIANVSHDLRTPLTLIAGYAEVMRDIPGENSAENAQVIIDEARRLSSLVSDVLVISKVQAGVTKPICVQYNLTNSTQKTVDRMGELLRKDGYTISFEYDREVDVSADETLISQCLYNLLLNAVQYGGQDKLVTVRQTVAQDTVKLEISDNGEGIAEENLEYVWERYYKIEGVHKRAVTGTGLGLSIVKSMIKAHGGEYGVTSQKGKGSTFWFSLKL